MSALNWPCSPGEGRQDAGITLLKLDTANRIILVFIWLRMYPEIALLSGMFMISPNTVEREIRFLLPMLWTHFRNLVRWPTHEHWMGMRNNWSLFKPFKAFISDKALLRVRALNSTYP